jgi:negative regulator of flagellin synthesis FlgM
MQMKINGLSPVNGPNPYNRQEPRHAERKEKIGRKKDELHISTEAKELLEAQGKGKDEQRSQRLNELKHAVSTGTYYVDARKIAEKLLPKLK